MPSAPLFRAAYRKVGTKKRLSRTLKKPLLRGYGLRTKRRYFLFLRKKHLSSWRCNPAMAKLANISGKEAARAFEKAGWREIGQVGSHLVMIKPGIRVNLSIPQHRELSVGTLRPGSPVRIVRR